MLLRVRDELRMTLHAYQTLYESSIAFGIRKALQAEQVNTWHIMSLLDLLNIFDILQCQGSSILLNPIFQGKTDMETRISKLEEDKAGLEKEVSDLKRSCEMIEKRAAEQKACVVFQMIKRINIFVNMVFKWCKIYHYQFLGC